MAATVTLAEAAVVLGISERTAYRLAAADEFPVPVLKIGRRRMVAKVQLDAFLAGEQVAS